MKVGILGTRGIPNHHGGFEQFAEFFAVFMAKKGHEIYVYNSSDHPFKEKQFNNVHIIRCYDPENKIGTIGQFIYDLNCILDARNRNFDILLQLGYTSNSIWGKLLPKKPLIVTNMDGLEWMRSKYSKPVRKFLKYAEKLAIKTSDFLIADSIGIQSYLKNEYGVKSKFIAYGASLFDSPDQNILSNYNLKPYQYDMLIARLEPENNIEVILEGKNQSHSKTPFLVIGKTSNKFGSYLVEKYRQNENIKFLGGIYNYYHLDNLRYFSNLYFHGHSVGGTNPSLLEAMASSALIVAHKNSFNESVIGDDGFYFKNTNEVIHYINSIQKKDYKNKLSGCKATIQDRYQWNDINNEYFNYFNELLG